MLTRKKRLPALTGMVVFISGAIALASPACAGITATAHEINGDVIITSAGTLDLSLWTYVDTVQQQPSVQADAGLIMGFLPGMVDVYMTPMNFTGPTSIGPGTSFHIADEADGAEVGIAWGDFPALFVPPGYQSGGFLVGTFITFENETFASLGLAKGQYTWTWDTADGSGDFFTINIPSPGAFAVLGLAALTTQRRRR